MTIDRVIRSYKWSLIEVGVITLLVTLGIASPGIGLGVALASAGIAYNRERLWLKNSG